MFCVLWFWAFQPGLAMLRDPTLEGSARCALMLRALREVVAAYRASPERVMSVLFCALLCCSWAWQC